MHKFQNTPIGAGERRLFDNSLRLDRVDGQVLRFCGRLHTPKQCNTVQVHRCKNKVNLIAVIKERHHSVCSLPRRSLRSCRNRFKESLEDTRRSQMLLRSRKTYACAGTPVFHNETAQMASKTENHTTIPDAQKNSKKCNDASSNTTQVCS